MRRIVFAGAAALGLGSAGFAWYSFRSPTPDASVEVEVHTDSPYHVFPPGEAFSLTVEPRLVAGELTESPSYQWVDFRGRALTPPSALPFGEATVVASPASRMQVGYYGLRLLPDDGSISFNPDAGLRREIGFAVLPAAEPRRVDVDARFGIVHFDYRDPYLDPGWMKTATEVQIGWDGTRLDPSGWPGRLERYREHGQMELPLIYRETWRRGSLAEIRTMMRGIFRADPRFDGTPSVPAYELGLEENLRDGSYADRLERTLEKFRVAGEERDRVDPGIRLAYQVAGTGMGSYRRLLESPLAHEIDVLSAHPYPWSDWPSPDAWHDGFVDELRAIMAENGVDVPIWYTEVGSSQNDANVPLMFSGRRPIGDGQTRAEYASYLVKLHASALENGIEKIFWYNYEDRDTSTTNAEDHFGLRDHWGHPKPGYAAYAMMLRCMRGRSGSRLDADARYRVYLFAGSDADCVVAWLRRDREETVPLEALWSRLVDAPVTGAFDTVGTPLVLEGGRVSLTTYPVFFLLEQASVPESGPQVPGP